MDGIDWGSVIDGMGSPGQSQGTAGPGASSTASTPTAPAAPGDPNAAPASTGGPDWGAAIDQVDAYHQQVAAGLTYAAKDANPDTAAQALTLSGQTGIPPRVVEANMADVQQREQTRQNNVILQQNPEVARWLVANPDAARVAQDDYAQLGTIGQLTRQITSGLASGPAENEMNRRLFAGETAATSPRVVQLQQALQSNGPADSGIAHWFAQQAGAIADSIGHALPDALVGASGGAAIGAAAAGLPSGGAGIPIGAAAGGAAGGAAGFGTGMFLDGYRTTGGAVRGELANVTDTSGNHIDPDVQVAASHFAGVIGGALNLVGAGKAASGLISAGVREAVASPTVMTALKSLGLNLLKDGGTGAAQGAGLGAIAGAANVTAEQVARLASGGNFDTVLNSPEQRQQAVSEIASSIGSMATLMGTMHAAGAPLGGFVRDMTRAQQAGLDVQRFQGLQDGAAASTTRGRAPDQFQAFMQQQLDGSPAENLFIPGDKVRSLYQSLGAEPSADDGLLGFVPDLVEQLHQADATGGDVVVPTAGYLTNLAGSDVSKQLLPDIRVRQDGMSMREAQDFQQQYSAALEDRARAAHLDYEADQASRAPVQQIADDVASQARQAGIGADAAQQYGALYGARYEARGERLGAEPLDLYRQENLRIVADLPDSIKTMPADALDAMLGALRSNRKPPSDADLNGPSLAEFLARRGGVLDQGGELSGIGADTWHRGQPGMPRLVRPALEDRGEALPGMAASDTLSSEHGLDGAAQAAWERGYLPGADNPGPPALMEALRREIGGDKVYSDRQGDPKARAQQEALADLRDTLDRAGLDPQVHSNAEIKAALASGDAPAQPARVAMERRNPARPGPATEPDAVPDLSTEGAQPPHADRAEQKPPAETITRASLEATSDTGDAARPGEVSSDAMSAAFHEPIADAVARGDNVVHVAGDGRETPLTSRDGRTVQASDGAPVGWMGMLSNKADRVEIRPGAAGDDATAAGSRRSGAEPPASGAAPRTEQGQRRAAAVAHYMDQLKADAPAGSGESGRLQRRYAANYLESWVGKDGGPTLEQAAWARERVDGRGFNQADREPVARITGEEIAPRATDLAELRTAARSFYDSKLRGTSVRSDALGADVEFRGSRKTFSASANPDKLRLFAALPDIIEHGTLENTTAPRDPRSEMNTKAYHYLTATVELDGKPVRVGAMVREDNAGHLYYNHAVVDGKEAVPPSFPLDTAIKAGPKGAAGGETTYEQRVGSPADGVNLDVRSLDQPDGSMPGQARGRIDFAEAGSTIRLFAKRDLSTFLHESGHQFLDEMTRDAVHPDATDQLRDDMASVLKWLGVDHTDQIGTDQHEQFARGFEAYLMEGKAPSAALETTFARFKAWLTAIYRNLAGLRVELSPEIRGVMDRLLATDDAIRRAQADAKTQRLFKTAADAVMTDKEFAAYERTAAGAKDAAERTLLDKTMADVRRQRTAWWKEEAGRVRDDVEPMVDSRPDMRALELLRRGKPRGSDADPVSLRLNRGDLEEMFGPGVTDSLPRSVPPVWTERGGVHPDVVAEMAGYRSGDEMVRGLMTLGERQRQLREAGDKRGVRAEAIDREVNDRMVERHGDVLTDGSIEEEASKAVHNEMQLRSMGIELEALGRRFKDAPRGRDEMAVVRDWARRTIGDKRVQDATATHQYARAEAKATAAVIDALEKSRPEEAYRQQRARMLNHALFIEAKRAADDADRTQRTMTRYANADTLPGMDQGALDQIHALLERLDFGKASGREVQRRQSLASWVEAQRAQGLEPAVPDRLLDDAFRQHYSQMTVNDLRGLSDAVQSIAHLGRLKQKLLDAKEARDFDALVQEAVDTAGRQPQRDAPTARRNPGEGGTGLDRLKGKLGTVGVALRSLDASMLKMEQVIQWLDGGDSGGVFNRVVFRRLSDAQVAEHDMQADIAGKFRKLNEALPKQNRAELNRLREVSDLPDSRTGKPSSMTKGEMLAVALNMGNEGNLTKMLDGEGWSIDQVRAAMDRHLDAEDWKFVQGTWDTIEGLWPQIAALEKRVSGVEPEKVERTPVETAHGTFEGGYYPLVYDPLRSFDVEQNRQRSGAALFENNYVRATTSQGHTIARNEGYARPLYLSLDVLPRHLNQVIHDLAYREAVMDADRFLAAPKVREAVEGALGREYYQQFRPWLQSIANDRTIDPRGLAWWDRIAHGARTNATMVGLGFRLSTMVIHGISASLNSLGEAGVRPMASAVQTFMRDPGGTKDFVFSKSGEMRNRMNEVDRDMRDVLRETGNDHGPLATVRRFSMQGVAMLDMASAMPTWLAGYNEALKGGVDDAGAVYAADQMVRNAHGAGGAKDTAAIQRGSETQKLFTMFYTFWNHLYNRQRDLFRDAGQMKSAGDFGSVLARSFFYLIAPPVIHGLISGGGPTTNDDGEQEGWAGWAAKHIALGLVSGVPVVRDVAGAIGSGRAYQMSPAGEAVGKAGTLAKDAGRALGMIDGEPSDRWVQHAIETPGYFLGLPTGQAAGAGQFLWDVMRGDEDPQGVSEWLHGIMYGPPPKK